MSTEFTAVCRCHVYYLSEARSGLPCELLYADDLLLMAPTMEQLVFLTKD